MRIKKSIIKNALEMHTLSNFIVKGNDAFKHAQSIIKGLSKYMCKAVPTKIICDDEEYEGYTSIAVISVLLNKTPYSIYQRMRRDNGIFHIDDKLEGIFVIMDKNMTVSANNINNFFEKYKS